MVEIYKPVVEDAGHVLNSSIAPSMHVRGDRELLSQLFANLIENSIVHTPAGTEISVCLECAGGAVIASVSDTGPGIPTEQHEKVLRRFYRLERARSRPGNGLGLALVAVLVEYHGASLTFTDNAPGLRVAVAFKDSRLA